MATTVNFNGINIHPDRDSLLTEQAKLLLEEFYLKEGETIQEAFARPALAFCAGDLQLAQRIYDYVSNRWAMYASPILSNAPRHGEKAIGLPISCFLSYVPDTREGLVDHQSELAWLSMLGGGVGGHWSDIRSVSKKSTGLIPHLKVSDSGMTAFKQGETRKGSYAAYLDVSHPDIIEFLNIRVPTGGDTNRKAFNIHNAVNLSNDFMVAAMNDQDWPLVCPHSKRVVETVSARRLLERIIETRFRTGEPYLNFIDTANELLPDALKRKGLRIHGSNLCNEIHLPTDERRTAVCCLSSVNLGKWDEWKDHPNFVQDWVRFLDNVLTYFIDNAPDEISKARYSAEAERSIGLGAMGFHTLLQQKGLPWDSPMAVSLNKRIFNHIKNSAVEETEELALIRGEAPDMQGTGRRNAHLLAIAPNANSSIICGCSASIEPIKSNAYTHKTRVGAHLVKNPQLELLLNAKAAELGKDSIWLEEQWTSIILNHGSVQHLTYLDDWEKDIYKTAFENDQRWVIQHAADRQPFVCQGQSVNVFFPKGSDRNYVLQVHLMAWRLGLKGLYYLRSNAGVQADTVSLKVDRVALKDYADQEECLACQG